MGKEAGGGPKRKKHHSGYYVSKGKVRTTHTHTNIQHNTTQHNTTQHNTNTTGYTNLLYGMETDVGEWVDRDKERKDGRCGDLGCLEC